MAENTTQLSGPDESKADTTPTNPVQYRVKLYKLDAEGTWKDQGTGYCVYTVGQEQDADLLFVRSEQDQEPLLSSKVEYDKIYQRQQDTLIVWTEDTNRDLALSFQDAEGCEEIWGKIQSKTQSADLARTAEYDSDGERPTSPQNKEPDSPTLLPPDLANLTEIQKVLDNAKTIQEKDRLASFVVLENYIEKMITTFNLCEDLEDIDDLHKLYNIVKSIIMLNDNGIIEYIIRDNVIFGAAGIMEYDPKTPKMKAKHRETLKKYDAKEPVVPIPDEAVMSKIRQTFRLRYLNDVMLSDCMDDPLASILHSLIFFNHIDIVNYMQHNRELLSSLLELLNADDTPLPKKKEVVQFVMQLCVIAKSLQATTRAGLYRTLASTGLFSVFDFALTNDDEALRTTGVNVLASIAELETALIRSHIMRQADNSDENQPTLLTNIIEQFTSDVDPGLKNQYVEILRLLLDFANGPVTGSSASPQLMRKQDPETDQFLTMFYDSYATMLLRPIEHLSREPMKLDGPIVPLNLSRNQSELCLYLCDLLCLAIRQHGFRSKYLMLSFDCFVKISQLYRCPESYIKLAALRVFRTCIGLKDEFYNQHLIKHNIFEPTIRVLLDTDSRNNLLNSACLELLEFLRKENVKAIISHLITQFGSVLDTIHYVETCKDLRCRYEQNVDAQETIKEEEPSTSTKKRREAGQGGWSSSTMDDDEEEYFNQSDEEEEEQESTTQSTKTQPQLQNKATTPLVDYEDEDEIQETPRPKRRLEEEDDDEDKLLKKGEHSKSILASPKKIIINTGRKK